MVGEEAPEALAPPRMLTWRSGEAGRRTRAKGTDDPAKLRFGTLFRSVTLRSWSKTEIRVGDVGKASSAGFLGSLTCCGLMGDRDGLELR